MTIASTLTQQTFQGDGEQRQFPFTFKAWEEQLKIIVTAANGTQSDVTADCAVSFAGDPETGGVVTFPTSLSAQPLPAGARLTVMRDMAFTQETAIAAASAYDSGVIENRLDILTAQDQQLAEELGRAVKVPVASGETPDDLLGSLYDARDDARDSAAAAAESAKRAERSAAQASASAQRAGQSEEQAGRHADRAGEARDTAIAQAEATNVLMAAELAKINAIVSANRDDQQAAIERARQWAEHQPGQPVEAHEDGSASYSARHWAGEAERFAGEATSVSIPSATHDTRGTIRVGLGLHITDEDMLNVDEATAYRPGMARMATQEEMENRTTQGAVPAFVTPEGLRHMARSVYSPGEFKNWFEQAAPPGWAVRTGGLLENADERFPELWAYLVGEGAWKCLDDAVWIAHSNGAVWNGIGGVPWFALNREARTIRLPDTRGMYVEDVGFDSLGVGGVHGDAIRNITGMISTYWSPRLDITSSSGALYHTSNGGVGCSQSNEYSGIVYNLDASRAVPVANKNQPRAFGMLPCVFVGGL